MLVHPLDTPIALDSLRVDHARGVRATGCQAQPHRTRRGELRPRERPRAGRALLSRRDAGCGARAGAGSKRSPAGRWGLLISLSGFSPVTTILAYSLLRPQRLLVLFSERTE